MFARTSSCHFEGLATEVVSVEAEILKGFSQFTIVGLAGTSIQEAKERIRSAIYAMGVRLPLGRIVINLYPGDVHKAGTQWDLPMAITLLSAMGRISTSAISSVAFLGELSLDGHLRSVPGALAMVLALKQSGKTTIYLPAENAKACSRVDGVTLYPVHHLHQVEALLQKKTNLQPIQGEKREDMDALEPDFSMDFGDLRGQEPLKRLLQIAVAGRHSLLLVGPPGVGKTMAMSRLPSILPPLCHEEEIEVLRIQSMSGHSFLRNPFPPFRTPHHTITRAAFLGGGNPPVPGEISLAHKGILFLDEMPQFSRELINGLRIPMEEKRIRIHRTRRCLEAPSDFQLMATANPCPCGYSGDPDHPCTCSAAEIRRYRSRLPGPLLDRIDMIYRVTRPCVEDQKKITATIEKDEDKNTVMDSRTMRQHIALARKRQINRYQNETYSVNAHFRDQQDISLLRPTKKALSLLNELCQHGHVSLRVRRRLLLVARTIADVDGKEEVDEGAIGEAFQYRRVDDGWGNPFSV